MQRTCSTPSSGSSYEDHFLTRLFGPDKPPRNAPKGIAKESKLFAAMKNDENDEHDSQDCEQCNQVITFDPLISDGTPDEIPHHLYWDHHRGKLPDYLQHLHTCACDWCVEGRARYRDEYRLGVEKK